MKKAVIDIGSNSVRIAIFADGIVIYRGKINAQLGEGMAVDKQLKPLPMARALSAIEKFFQISKEYGVDKAQVFMFATAAVRNSLNGKDFCNLVESAVNRPIDVLSGKEEGVVALNGALGGADGACLDIGGASTELSVAKGGKVVFAVSLELGAVVLHDLFGEDRQKLNDYILRQIQPLADAPVDGLTAIGGTCSCCAFISRNGGVFNRDENHGAVLTKSVVLGVVDKLFALSREERQKQFNISAERAKVICGGALLFYNILNLLGQDRVVISENDNLEGYYLKLGGKSYEV